MTRSTTSTLSLVLPIFRNESTSKDFPTEVICLCISFIYPTVNQGSLYMFSRSSLSLFPSYTLNVDIYPSGPFRSHSFMFSLPSWNSNGPFLSRTFNIPCHSILQDSSLPRTVQVPYRQPPHTVIFLILLYWVLQLSTVPPSSPPLRNNYHLGNREQLLNQHYIFLFSTQVLLRLLNLGTFILLLQ